MLINFNFAITLALLFQLTACVTVNSVLVISLSYMSLFKCFKTVGISALLLDPKGQRIVVVL